MVTTRSHDGDSKGKDVVTDFQRTTLELKNTISKQFAEIMAAINRLRDDRLGDDRSTLDRYSPSSQKVKGSGSKGLERFGGDDRRFGGGQFREGDRQTYVSRAELLDLRFRDYLMLRNDDDDETWTWTETDLLMDDEVEIREGLAHKAILEEKSTPQFQVPIANSEILRSIEPGKVDLGLENEEYVVLNENLAQDWVQKNVKVRFEADGDVGKGQKVISNTKICCAHKVFGKMSQHQERLGIKKKKKGLKSWMFKYKKGNKKRDLLLLNGKDSLALRAIGTGLETVERDSSNQEKSKLCTEDKGELKGCLERLQASVLLKEESESMVVNEVKAEFKTFDKKSSNKTLSLEDEHDDEHEQNQELLDTSQKMQTRLVYHEEKNGLRVVEAGINKSFMTLEAKVETYFWAHYNYERPIRHNTLVVIRLHKMILLMRNAEMTIPLVRENQAWIENAGFKIQSSLKLFHQLRVARLHHTSLGFLYGSLPRPPEENHSNLSNMLQYHETWSCLSLRTNRVWDPGGSETD